MKINPNISTTEIKMLEYDSEYVRFEEDRKKVYYNYVYFKECSEHGLQDISFSIYKKNFWYKNPKKEQCSCLTSYGSNKSVINYKKVLIPTNDLKEVLKLDKEEGWDLLIRLSVLVRMQNDNNKV